MMTRRLFLSLLLLSLLSHVLEAQQSERVLRILFLSAEQGQPLPDVLCSTWNAEGRRIQFQQSDRAGRLELKLLPEARRASFVLLGYATQELTLRAEGDTEATLRMQPKVTKLREVHVTAAPIRQQGDTLHYRVKAFAGAQDRYLEDVLKKLPGIRVSESGRIEYQGRPINKFYIEGQDPLGMNYNQASRNIPTEAVDQVDVIEHNQHQRVLKGRIPSDQAALNIRLSKAYRFRPFGELAAGAGLPAPLWQGKLFLMQAAKTNQLITNLSTNNRGKDLATDFVEHDDFAELSSTQPLPGLLLRSSGTEEPPLPSERYLRNRAWSWSVNDLQKVSEYTSLRLNVIGYHDLQLSQSERSTLYQGQTSYSLGEQKQHRSQPSYYRGKLLYEHNAPKNYLTWELTYASLGEQAREQLTAESRHYGLELRQRPQYLESKLSSTLTLGKTLLLVTSQLRGYSAEEQLVGEVERAAAAPQPLGLGLRLGQISTRHSAASSFALGKWQLSSGLSLESVHSYYGRSGLLHQTGDDRLSHVAPSLDLSLSSRGDKDYLSFSLPLTYSYDELRLGGQVQRQHLLHGAPQFSMRHQFSPYYDMTLRVGYQLSPDRESYYAAEELQRSYRHYYRSLQDLRYHSSFSAGIGWAHQQPIEQFFVRLNLSYRQSRPSYYRDVRYSPTRTVSVPVDSSYLRRNYSLMGSLDKTFTDIAFSTRLDVNYSQRHDLASLLGRAYRVRSDLAFARLALGWTKLQPLDLRYAVQGSSLWVHQPFAAARPVLSMEEQLTARLSLGDDWSLLATGQHTMAERLAGGYQHSFFADLEAEWKASKRFRFTARLSNLLNQVSYVEALRTATTLEHYSQQLRPREFLLSLWMKL